MQSLLAFRWNHFPPKSAEKTDQQRNPKSCHHYNYKLTEKAQKQNNKSENITKKSFLVHPDSILSHSCVDQNIYLTSRWSNVLSISTLYRVEDEKPLERPVTPDLLVFCPQIFHAKYSLNIYFSRTKVIWLGVNFYARVFVSNAEFALIKRHFVEK